MIEVAVVSVALPQNIMTFELGYKQKPLVKFRNSESRGVREMHLSEIPLFYDSQDYFRDRVLSGWICDAVRFERF